MLAPPWRSGGGRPDFVNYGDGAARLTRGSALPLAVFDLVLHGLDNREYAHAHALPRKENP